MLQRYRLAEYRYTLHPKFFNTFISFQNEQNPSVTGGTSPDRLLQIMILELMNGYIQTKSRLTESCNLAPTMSFMIFSTFFRRSAKQRAFDLTLNAVLGTSSKTQDQTVSTEKFPSGINGRTDSGDRSSSDRNSLEHQRQDNEEDKDQETNPPAMTSSDPEGIFDIYM